MVSKDKELQAMSSIIKLLKPLNATERSRVLEYVLKRLEMATLSAPSVSSVSVGESKAVEPTNISRFAVKDIRSFTAEKQPRTANEMVAVVGYYLSELAPEAERTEKINTELVKRYFKMAAFPLPSVLRNMLHNAAAAGYLENISHGEYRLNPVGYNLVVHRLPQGGGGTSPSPTRKKRKKVGRK